MKVFLFSLLLLQPQCVAFSPNNSHLPNCGDRLCSSTSDEDIVLPSRARLLPDVQRYRGSVDQGYGRGGKKLGIPTANLPSSLFQNALEEVTTGVYFGWAALERSNNNGIYELHKAVVNVGYSPTFEGEENKEKIIEAHLIVEKEDKIKAGSDNCDDERENTCNTAIMEDFYGTPMRLQLLGFLREERKFDSFPELIAQINSDVEDAKLSLNCEPYKSCSTDPFFNTLPSPWVGNGGGDETASWESAPIEEFLDDIK
eukprot:CAMPEP_0197187412 /NCGR_PEP_ID=MMETSP1423-20130617/15800_1 /TAXON_ID=476441 /ORGANISM="Pseudo-nitzschia heimii, Strain UNC1101" /LENGTH=256 /DNA_ID=CAMNT_0042638975 /DNA_START=318 /DNA_END=1088 /DNA_ORIENTATION=-